MSACDPKTLLLHCCCAPCGTYPIRLLSETYAVTAYFYNPNIHPKEEYLAREKEMCQLMAKWNYPLIVGDYDDKLWFEAVKGLEKEPEGGKRCDICFKMRLLKTAETAKAHGIDSFTTTLSISPHKNAELLNQIGHDVAKTVGISYVEANFKKKNGFKISCDLSAEEGLYRQNYCGCIYSKREMEERMNRR